MNSASVLVSYVPDLALRWADTEPPAHHLTEGTLVSVDISGFTRLSERLAAFGTSGAEELADLLNACFGSMIETAAAAGGDVVKFGGDALLLFFEGDGHAERACRTCIELREIVAGSWGTPSIPRVALAISQGAHTGEFAFFRLDGPHTELLVVGPGVTETVGCEGEARGGQILVSRATAAAVDPRLLGSARNDRRFVRRRRRPDRIVEPAPGRQPIGAPRREVAGLLPRGIVDQVVAGGSPGEHRQAAVGFVRFAGTDELVASGDMDSVLERLQLLADAVHAATAQTGTHWIASDAYIDGGKVVIAAGAPVGLGLDEDRAVRALRQILDSDCGLALSAGVNRGGVYMGDLGSPRRRTFTTVGEAVAVSARLMEQAAVGELLASVDVLRRVPTAFGVGPAKRFLIKGKRQPVDAAAVGARTDPHSLVEVKRPDLPLVGRMAELESLEHALAEVVAGRGQVIDLVAEPGIGKTRLVQELSRRHPQIRSVRLAAGPYGRTTPHFGVRRLIRALAGADPGLAGRAAGEWLGTWVGDVAPELLPWLPLLAVPFDAEVAPTEAVSQLGDAYRAARLLAVVGDLIAAVLDEPTIVVAEDLHWLDDSSTDLIEELARRVDRQAWLLVVARSPGPRALDLGADALTVELGHLTDDETAELMDLQAGVSGVSLAMSERAALTERAGGHPLLALELVNGSAAGTAEGVPDTVEALVTARIDDFAAEDRVAIRDAAVVGQVVDLTLIAGALDAPDLEPPARWTSLSSLVAIGPGATVQFRHALYRRVAYAGSTVRRRREVHRRVGTWLEGRVDRAGQDHVSLLSLHFDRARVPDKAWRYSVDAGHSAQHRHANVDAAEFYRRAIRAVAAGHGVADDELADVHDRLGDVLELDARYADAAKAYSAASRALPRDSAQAVVLFRKQGVLRERQAEYTQALRWYGRGLTAAERLPETARRSVTTELALAYAGVRHRQGRQEECVKWARRAASAAVRDGDQAAQAHAYHLLALAYAYLRSDEAERYRDKALPMYEQLGDLVGQANVLNNMGILAYFEGRWDAALEHYERAHRARAKVGDVVGAAIITNNIGEVLMDQGRIADAQGLFHQALDTFRSAGYAMGEAMALSNLGAALIRTHDVDAGRDMVTRARAQLEALSATTLLFETARHELRAWLAARRPEAALALADDLLASLPDTARNPVVVAQLERHAGEALVALGRTAEASDRLGLAIDRATDAGASFELALSLELRGSIPGEHSDQDRRRAGEILRRLGVRRSQL